MEICTATLRVAVVSSVSSAEAMGITPLGYNDTAKSAEALAEMERYCKEHPRSPSAVRRPRIMIRGRSCVALLGSTLEDGIAGIGSSVRGALRAFDVQYSNSLKPPRD